MRISKIIAKRLKEKPLGGLSDILRGINDNRQEQHIEILVNDENVRLRGFSHYKGYSGILIFGHCSKHIRHFDEGKLFQKTYIYLNYIYGITNSTIFGVRYESGE